MTTQNVETVQEEILPALVHETRAVESMPNAPKLQQWLQGMEFTLQEIVASWMVRDESAATRRCSIGVTI